MLVFFSMISIYLCISLSVILLVEIVIIISGVYSICCYIRGTFNFWVLLYLNVKVRLKPPIFRKRSFLVIIYMRISICCFFMVFSALRHVKWKVVLLWTKMHFNSVFVTNNYFLRKNELIIQNSSLYYSYYAVILLKM